MIGISKLYCGGEEGYSDQLRYGQKHPGHAPSTPPPDQVKPIVVWNCTQRCNLKCAHCYACSTDALNPDELSDSQARAMIDDLGRFKAHVLLFSGGEPLLRKNVLDLIVQARSVGMRAVISTNGTLITPEIARQLAQVGLNYAGVSLDGLLDVNDSFRGVRGAFDAALRGIRNCLAAGVRVGLRLTMNRQNIGEIPGIFDLIEREGIPRVCFYHLVSTGRGRGLDSDILTHAQTRAALDTIMDRTAALHAAGKNVQVLTVDNHADGPYVYLRLREKDPDRAAKALALLQANGGNSSGSGIACVSWNGDVMPDQFWRQHVLGNVCQRPFSEIWTDPAQPLLAKLRDRKNILHCRCQHCRWMSVCNGNFRARAEAAGDPWGDDPACYLTDQEIS